jgi:hypothetical protein
MRNKLLLVLGLVCAFGILSVQDSRAAIYKYVDKDGLINFADDLQSIPAPDRGTAKIVSGEPAETNATSPAKNDQVKAQAGTGTPEAAPAAAPAAGQEKQQPVESRGKTEFFGKRALTSVIIIVSTAFAFIILGILDIDNKKIVTVVRVILMWGMTVYLLYVHAGDVVGLFSTMGAKMQSVHQKSEEKGKKAARALKNLNALVDQAEQSSADPVDTETEKKE